MPHQCVRCNKLYEDGSSAIIKGCECGGKFFFFVRQKNLKESLEITEKLTEEEKQKIQEDALSLVGIDLEETPIVLDFESIRIKKPGKYEIDLVDIFKKKPLVYKLEDGKYVIDLASTFEIEEEKKKNKKSGWENITDEKA